MIILLLFLILIALFPGGRTFLKTILLVILLVIVLRLADGASP